MISELETETAAVIRGVSASRLVPEPEAAQRHVLLDFIALQKLRTAAVGGRNDVQTDYLAKVWAQSHPELSAIDPEQYRIVNRYPVAAATTSVSNGLADRERP